MIAREHAKYTKKLTVILLVECCWWHRHWHDVKGPRRVKIRTQFIRYIVRCKSNDTNASKSMNHWENRIVLSQNDHTWWYHSRWITINAGSIHPQNIDIGQYKMAWNFWMEFYKSKFNNFYQHGVFYGLKFLCEHSYFRELHCSINGCLDIYLKCSSNNWNQF